MDASEVKTQREDRAREKAEEGARKRRSTRTMLSPQRFMEQRFIGSCDKKNQTPDCKHSTVVPTQLGIAPPPQARKKSLATQEKLLIGQHVRKFIPTCGWFDGVVKATVGSNFEVHFVDGDRAELSRKEVEKILVRKPRRPAGNPSMGSASGKRSSHGKRTIHGEGCKRTKTLTRGCDAAKIVPARVQKQAASKKLTGSDKRHDNRPIAMNDGGLWVQSCTANWLPRSDTGQSSRRDQIGFTMGGITFRVGDCVYLKSDAAAWPYIARLERLREADDGQKIASIRWFYRYRDTFEGTRLFEQVHASLETSPVAGENDLSSEEVFLAATMDLADEFSVEDTVVGKPTVAHWAEVVSGTSKTCHTTTDDVVTSRLKAWCEKPDHFYYRMCFDPELFSWFDAPLPDGTPASVRAAVEAEMKPPKMPDRP